MFSRSEQAPLPHNFKARASFLPKREPKKPRVILSRRSFALITLYVEIAQQEVGWLGTVRRLPSGDFFIENCFLFKQEVHETETEISNEGLSELSMELLNGDTSGPEEEWDVNKLRFWGHSHVRMGTNPSPTDDRSMLNDYGSSRSANTGQQRFCFEESGYPWVIRGIFNKHGQANFDIFMYEEGLKFEDVEWTVEDPDSEQAARHKAEDEQKRKAYTDDFLARARRRKEEEEAAARLKQTPTIEINGEPIAADGSVLVKIDKQPDEKPLPEKKLTEPTPAPVAASLNESRKSDDPEWYKTDNGFLSGLRQLFSSARALKYRPDITPELRAAVNEEFKKKVRSVSRSFGFWGSGSQSNSGGYGSRSGSFGADEPRDTAPYTAFSQVERELVIDGEASGPGTTGDFGPSRPVQVTKPYSPSTSNCPPTAGFTPRPGCNCAKCIEARRTQRAGSVPVAPLWASPKPRLEEEASGPGFFGLLKAFFLGTPDEQNSNKGSSDRR
ncbi:MAG: hypothetical protein K2X27_00235 [Candidatus Obscuribacterales bacterium]|nr:hypothetical protein [Candidatus Obscuribacterales bacterium]